MKKATVKNETKGTEFEIDYADSWFRKAFGLMFRTRGRMVFPIDGDSGVVHTWFVLTSLHLYWVKDGEVFTAPELEPFSSHNSLIFSPDYLIESSEDLGFEVGDKVTVEVDK